MSDRDQQGERGALHVELISPMWWRVVAPAACVMAGSLAWGALWPRSRWFGPVIWRGDVERESHRLALLIECPRNAESFEQLLRLLHEADVPAAFAVDRLTAETLPTWLRQVDGGGHLLVNAGPAFEARNLFAGYPAWRQAIDRTEDAIYEAIGRRPLLFAPPHALTSPVMLREAAWGGHGLVTRARGQHAWLPQQLDTARLLRSPNAGVVAIRADRERTLEQLPALIEGLRSRGRLLTRLDMLLNLPPYRRAGSFH